MSNHSSKEFVFVAKNGEEKTVKSKPYTLALESVLLSRFGVDFNHYQSKGVLEYDLTIEEVNADMPKLLYDVADIEFKDQAYDEILEVYLFFLQYKKNAVLRHTELEREIMLSDLEVLKKSLDSIPQSIWEKMKS